MGSFSILVVAIVFSLPAAGPAGARETPADRLVGQALQAEIKGDNAQRAELLQQALRLSPKCEAARWQTGHVLAERQWLTLVEAEKAAAASPRLQRYRKMRAECSAQMTPTVTHLTMARWCQPQAELAEHARFHWLKLLERDPNSPEALTALDLCWYQGELIGRDEVQARDKAQQAAQKWTRRLQELADRLDGNDDAASVAAASGQLRSIKDVEAIPGLETVVAPRSETLGLEVVAVLGQMRSHWAAGSLVRLSQSSFSEVRKAATEQLKRRSLEQTVPWALAGMGWPAKLEQRVQVGLQGNVVHDCVVSVEGAQARVTMDLGAATLYNDEPVTYITGGRPGSWGGPIPRRATLNVPSPAMRHAHRQATYQTYANRALQTEQQVAAYNARVETQNAAASRLLYDLTGENRGPDPDAWLDWWTHYNEVTHAAEKPVYHMDGYQTRVIHDGPVLHIRYGMSCFTRGTLVRTQAGLMPIERVQPGDMVLSQHPDTGELTYRAVLETTLRPPSPLFRIRVEDEDFTATRGHPFWVAGEGWRMAKQLKTEDRLHGLAGSWPVGQIEPLPDDEAYNLVVDDFHTYFVGRLGLLVHDNAPRQPTTAVLPGLHVQ